MSGPTRRAVLAGATAAAACAGAPPLARGRPNFLLVVADDMGWSDPGCFGGEAATPNLDALARNGLRFTRFINAGRCAPTRAALLTGLPHHRAGIAAFTSAPDRPIETGPYQGFLSLDTPTLPEMLRPFGYRAYASGKWHQGERPEHWPRQRGFDRYFGLISGASSHFALTQDGHRPRVMALDDASVELEPGFYSSRAYADWALRFLEEHAAHHAAQPFFLYLAFTAPHWPLHAPPEALARYASTYLQGPQALRQKRLEAARALGLIDGRYRETPAPALAGVDAEPALMAAHAAMLSEMDHAMGRVFEALRRMGSWDNTVVVFLSDNGASAEDPRDRNAALNNPEAPIGAPGSYRGLGPAWAWAANAPFRGVKGTPYEGGINTPAIMHWPDGLHRPGAVTQTLCHVTDIAPTLVDIAGGGATGRSLRSLLETGAAPAARPIFHEHVGWGAYYDEGYKALYDREIGAWSLFDMQADPAEAQDLADRDRPRLARLRQAWLAQARELGVRNTPPAAG